MKSTTQSSHLPHTVVSRLVNKEHASRDCPFVSNAFISYGHFVKQGQVCIVFARLKDRAYIVLLCFYPPTPLCFVPSLTKFVPSLHPRIASHPPIISIDALQCMDSQVRKRMNTRQINLQNTTHTAYIYTLVTSHNSRTLY